MTLFITILLYLIFVLCLVAYKKDISIANFTWGGGCALVALYAAVLNENVHIKQIVAVSITTLWCMRMVAHLYVRYTGKDPRFLLWNGHSGVYAVIKSAGYIFCIQLPLLLVMSVPIFFMMKQNSFTVFTRFEYFLIDLWLFGLLYETVADYQLYRFLSVSKKKNVVMSTGLWRYSRHPNYFGEIVLWWASAFFVFMSVKNIIVFVAPITITILLTCISGVPLIEKAMKNNKHYQQYKKQTSVIIPWFVRH